MTAGRRGLYENVLMHALEARLAEIAPSLAGVREVAFAQPHRARAARP